MLFDLIKQSPQAYLTPLFTPQLASIFINLVKLDNISEPNQRLWPNAFTDLLAMITDAASDELGQLFYKFFLRCMLVFDEEVVERAESKSLLELHISNQIKDCMREEVVAKISALQISVLQNYQ